MDFYGPVLVFESKSQKCGPSGHNPCVFSLKKGKMYAKLLGNRAHGGHLHLSWRGLGSLSSRTNFQAVLVLRGKGYTLPHLKSLVIIASAACCGSKCLPSVPLSACSPSASYWGALQGFRQHAPAAHYSSCICRWAARILSKQILEW